MEIYHTRILYRPINSVWKTMKKTPAYLTKETRTENIIGWTKTIYRNEV